MKRQLLCLSFLPILLLTSFSASAQKGKPALGINLEGYDYPYPVKYHTLYSQGQQLNMAYMYEQAPESDNKTVLLLHGKNFNGAYWGQTTQALLDNGFSVLVPDQIGFGKSSKPDFYHFTFQQLAQNTKALADSLGVSDMIVLGHSMGGMLATRFALMYPDNVDKLVLENPIGLEDWKTMVPYPGIEYWYKSELKKTRKGIKSYMLTSYFDNQWKGKYNEWVYLLAAVTESPDYDRYAWNAALTYDMIFTQPVYYEFGNIKMPTVLIIGQRDRTALGKNLVPDSVAAKMGNYPKLGKATAKKIPNATLIELNDIGHLPHIENFDLFIDKLLPSINR